MTLDGIDDLGWREFEDWVATLLRSLGYETEKLAHFDPGDLVATRGGVRAAVQVKHRKDGRWIGRKALDAVCTARREHGCTTAIVVTNGRFAPDMSKRARFHDVELWDRKRLSELIDGGVCEICGKHVTARVREWCLSREDEYHGRIYCFEHQRTLEGVLRVAN